MAQFSGEGEGENISCLVVVIGDSSGMVMIEPSVVLMVDLMYSVDSGVE